MIEPTAWLEWAAVFGAGLLAGIINVIVGAGTLVSFPILVALGIPPVTATIANTIGIVPGSMSGVVVYRKELSARWKTVAILLPASMLGGVFGALLLLHAPTNVFSSVIPWIIGTGTFLVIVGPAIRRWLASGSGHAISAGPPHPSAMSGGPAKAVSIGGAMLLGVYGGFFSAAQGILLIALLGITTFLQTQELNAIKNLTVAAVNVIAAIVFTIVSPTMIAWKLVAVVAAGSALGGVVGGRFARRLPAIAFRIFVVVVGIATVAFMVLKH